MRKQDVVAVSSWRNSNVVDVANAVSSMSVVVVVSIVANASVVNVTVASTLKILVDILVPLY